MVEIGAFQASSQTNNAVRRGPLTRPPEIQEFIVKETPDKETLDKETHRAGANGRPDANGGQAQAVWSSVGAPGAHSATLLMPLPHPDSES